ncbi:MAG: 50S ribosomal protein L3 [Oligoflexia bacterium]|nr:50S ribosomal protein L3 [Oligoflexia bacterium]
MENKLELPVYFGIKAGMTRVFNSAGVHMPVTIIKIIPNFISQVKTKDKEGYAAYQVSYLEKKKKLVNKPTRGHLNKAGVSGDFTKFSEVRLRDSDADASNLGKQISLDMFKADVIVDVSSVSKGKGFQGVIKKHHFAGGPAAHGSHFHRHPGAIGNRATPARVFAERKMPGHMGCENVTIKNQKIVEVNEEKGYLLIKGVVPGSLNTIVKITKAGK